MIGLFRKALDIVQSFFGFEIKIYNMRRLNINKNIIIIDRI